MKVTSEYLVERHAYWVKRIAEARIWDATMFKPVEMVVKKNSKIYRGRFIRKWVKVSPTLMELHDSIVIYQKYARITERDIDNILVEMMILQYLQQNNIENLSEINCCYGMLFIDIKNKINKAFPKEVYVEGL